MKTSSEDGDLFSESPWESLAAIIGGTSCFGAKITVSNPQCGQGTAVFSAAPSWLASNSIPPLQCWQWQVTRHGGSFGGLLMVVRSRLLRVVYSLCGGRLSAHRHLYGLLGYGLYRRSIRFQRRPRRCRFL